MPTRGVALPEPPTTRPPLFSQQRDYRPHPALAPRLATRDLVSLANVRMTELRDERCQWRLARTVSTSSLSVLVRACPHTPSAADMGGSQVRAFGTLGRT
jgi:hypothetical protein